MRGKATVVIAILLIVAIILVKNGSLHIPNSAEFNNTQSEELSWLDRYNRFADRMNSFWGGVLKDLGLTDEVKNEYKYEDSLVDNVNEYSDKVTDYISDITLSPSENTLEPVEVIEVIDGDTILVEMNGVDEKVRFIGIDTPESVNSDESKNNIYGTYASDYTKSLLNGIDTVYLQYDKETVDQYGRVLAYVWLKEDVDVSNATDVADYMVNAILLEEGYAYDKVYMPNDAYSSVFNSYRTEAQSNSTGLWKYEEFELLWE